jgi:hypothetical protein
MILVPQIGIDPAIGIERRNESVADQSAPGGMALFAREFQTNAPEGRRQLGPIELFGMVQMYHVILLALFSCRSFCSAKYGSDTRLCTHQYSAALLTCSYLLKFIVAGNDLNQPTPFARPPASRVARHVRPRAAGDQGDEGPEGL